jgi:AcrR family transcriptional regulator
MHSQVSTFRSGAPSLLTDEADRPDENERSFSVSETMVNPSSQFSEAANAMPSSERREAILEAAQACFVRTGFHRTTMQDVAREAGMSAGNLYRYFASKDALVAGLAERDRATIVQDFNTLVGASDFLGAFEAIGRRHLVELPRSQAVLAVEIWSEATRNPAVASFCTCVDHDLRGLMRTVFAAAQANGAIAAHVNLDQALTWFLTIADGLFKRRAVEPDFDGEHELATAFALFRAIFAGKITPAPTIETTI